jgi:hypothetical protein
MSLTPGAAKKAISLASQAEDPTFQPVFQVISVEEVGNVVGAERFRLVLSDGQYLVPVMLSTQLNHLVTSNELQEDSLLSVEDFMNNGIQGRNVLILLEATVLRKAGKRIGKPIPLDDKEKAEPSAEISKFEALNVLLTDESLSDLKLASEIDGEQVLAHRNMLAARSRVFRRMLYGDMPSLSVVDLPYPSKTIKAIVTYIYTNIIPDPAEFSTEDDFVSVLVSTIDAATYFELATFRDKCETLAKTEIDRNPKLGVRFLAMCGRFPSLKLSNTSKGALQQICRSPGLLLETERIVPLLSYSQVKSIVKNPDVLSDEYTLLQVIDAWAKVTDDRFTPDFEIHRLEDDKIAPTSKVADFASRHEAAGNLTKYINLASIPPSKLVSVAATSDLISQEQLFGAFKTQAYLAEKKSGNFCDVPRHPVWESSSSLTLAAPPSRQYYTLELLKCQPLRSGVHTWSVLMQETSEWICVGVHSSEHELIHDTLLGCQVGGWALSSDGTVTHNNSQDQATGLKFQKGSTVTFTLDLTGSGTLSGIVDDKLPATLLFPDMFAAFEGGKETAGFVPVVELYPTDKVEFLGFERNDDDDDETHALM